MSLIRRLTSSQKEKEDLEEISMELELVDEEEKVPYVSTPLSYFLIQLHPNPFLKICKATFVY